MKSRHTASIIKMSTLKPGQSDVKQLAQWCRHDIGTLFVLLGQWVESTGHRWIPNQVQYRSVWYTKSNAIPHMSHFQAYATENYMSFDSYLQCKYLMYTKHRWVHSIRRASKLNLCDMSFCGCKQHTSFCGVVCVTNKMTSLHRWCGERPSSL